MAVLRSLGPALAIAATLAAAPCAEAAPPPRPQPEAANPPAPEPIRGFWKFGSTVVAVAEAPDATVGACYVGQPVGASYVDFDDEGRLAIQFTSEMITQRNGAPTDLGKAAFSGAAILRYAPGGDGRIEFIARGAGFTGGAERYFDSAFQVTGFSASLAGSLLRVEFRLIVDTFPGRCVFAVAGVYHKGVYR